jgi:formate hydrogenlyase subunit 6/NADH:ubiquinone oxidoreductase subunit I
MIIFYLMESNRILTTLRYHFQILKINMKNMMRFLVISIYPYESLEESNIFKKHHTINI